MTLTCRNIVKKLGFTTVLDDISLDVNKGEIFGILGVNGAGKTTLMNIFATVTKPNSGKLFFNDNCIYSSLLDYRKVMGYSPQEASFPLNSSIYDTLIYMAKLKGIGKESYPQIDHFLEIIGFTDIKKNKITRLSHGQEKLISIIHAFIGSPEIIILDEPFSNLDPLYVDKIKRLINEHKNNSSIIITEHHLDVIEELCSHIAIINNGNIKVQGSINKILCKNHILNIQLEKINKEDIKKIKAIKGIKSIDINQNNLKLIYEKEVFDKVYKIFKKDIISIKKGKNLQEIFIEYSK
jgi:ABC-2 type transport system ATP-binding protein